MQIKQFEYKPLAHYSYAIVSQGKMAVIDPERDPMHYYAYAEKNNATIVAVLETHPHADFVSSHLQIHEETGATIYCSKKLGADYPHQSFDDEDSFQLGGATISAINTPGHSPDSISIVAKEGDEVAVFTGDTLFIGDVGRPDLRENVGNMTAKRQELAEMMYHTVQHKYNDLPDDAIVYPAHGAGSLCGKNMSSDNSSTMGNERMSNWAFKDQSQEEFVNTLLDSQPFIPSYFGFDVDVNKAGAKNLRKAKANVTIKLHDKAEGLIVDVRDEAEFKKGHLPNSINIQAVSKNAKFETWLGSVIQPEEAFSIVVKSSEEIDYILNRVAKIGYEGQLDQIITLGEVAPEKTPTLDLGDFKKNPSKFTIVDIRNQSEINEGKFFENALPHPLNELRDTAKNIPIDKPIVVHCAGGYRSAAGSSILETILDDVQVYDLSDAVKEFQD
ncbi:MBL fold metallo-hydrolase [Gangjinia marincola]|uniref:MBL fold metallo-hydrolase n=1 Tax=Gangjinia marincola TaxID=578463 RepID=A0ABN1MK92_9FLAO